MFERNAANTGAVIKVIGVGGGGGNAVNYMVAHGLEGVEFICANTDSQALHGSSADKVIQIGENMTKGLGAGTNPEVGRAAAMEDRQEIEDALRGTDMLFITTGMGGGTGTGATPVIAEIAKEMGILTVAVVTRPFPFEGKRRKKMAEEGIRALAQSVDSLITIPNEKLLTILGKDASLVSAFAKADDVLCSAVRGISDIINRPGLINVDFADVKAVMSEMGMALMGTGSATGPSRAREATEAAVHNPLLSNVNLMGARGILVNITAGSDLSLGEYSDVGSIIEEFASEDAIVKVGTVVDPNLRDELHVTVVATGLDLTEELNHSRAAPVRSNQAYQSHQPQQPRQEQYEQPRLAANNYQEDLRRQPVQDEPALTVQDDIHARSQEFAQREYSAPVDNNRHAPSHKTMPSQHRRPVAQNASQQHPQDRRVNPQNADEGYDIAAYQNAPAAQGYQQPRELPKASHQVDTDYLDIPAFLRRDHKNRH